MKMMKLGQKTSQEADDRKVAAASSAASREVAWTLHHVDHIDHVDHVALVDGDDGDHVDHVAFVDGDDGDYVDHVDSDDDVGDFFCIFFSPLYFHIVCFFVFLYCQGWLARGTGCGQPDHSQ